MKVNTLHKAIRASLYGSAVLGLALAAPVQAQDQDQDSDTAELDRIEVTGSRIKRTDIESASPVFVIQRAEIERSGLTSIGDLLQDLPIAGAALNTNFNNGGNGETRLDLRNLGSNRLLVLLNGRRFVTGLSGRVDLNNIPTAVIKRIEILKDGASAIYGSDAISGVVNIITRDDFEGMQANAQFGQFEGENDGEIQAYDFSVGTTSDRGSVYFNASYVKAEPVWAGDRTIAAEPQFGTGNAFGSSGTPQGRFCIFNDDFGSCGLTTAPGTDVAALGTGAFINGDFSFGAPGDGADRFNFAPSNYMLTPQERTNIFTQGTYDVTDDVRMSVEASFNNRLSSRLLAPTPLFIGLFGNSVIGVAADNIYNPFGELPGSSWGVGRRMIEAGPRVFADDVDSYRFSLGFEGSFEVAERYFDWDVNYVYGEVTRNIITEGLLNLQRVTAALSGQPCRDDVAGDGCVELNLFGGQGPDGNGTITQDMLDYILFTAQDSQGNQLRNYTANLTGDLFEMPAGALSFAAGYEYRQLEGFDQPDAIIAAGITSGNSRQPTSGSVTVDELYLEFAVPLLSGVSGAERLDLSLAARWSDYDTFGSTTNGKIGLEWQPIDDLLIRATYSEGFRAPNISELFAGQGDSFPILNDPCSDMLGLSGGVPASASIVNNCIAQGVPADGTYTQVNAQIRITVGSNPNLTPETSESITAGFVYSPSWADGLDITVDFYNIELTNTISSVGPQTILNACANSLSLCSLITRTTNGNVSDLLAAGINLGGSEVEGVDFLVSYSFPETDYGFFRAVWDSAYQSTNSDTVPDVEGGGPDVINEFIGFNVGDGAFARWKSNLDLNWSYGDWDATWGIQYIHGQTEICQIPDAFGFCNAGTDTNGNSLRKIGATTYHDVQVSYHLSEYDTRLTFGVQNLMDKGPPISTAAFANSFDAADYRVPGRFPYVRMTVDF